MKRVCPNCGEEWCGYRTKAACQENQARIARELSADPRWQQAAELRALQNRLIELAERQGFIESTRVSTDMPDYITIGHMKAFICPGYEREIRTLINRLESR